MMQTLHPASGFTSEASLSGRPHTPPYTPARAAKRRLERSDSPASTTGSIHPAETDSPAKKAAKRSVQNDDIRVEELVEGDMGYMTDIDVVYPEELEEVSSSDGEVEHIGDGDVVYPEELEEVSSSDGEVEHIGDGDVSDVSDSEATQLTRKLSRLRCGNDGEVRFEQMRRQKHSEKRRGSRLFKRKHSQIVTSGMDETDIDAPDGQDQKATVRRTRRRTNGPRDGSNRLEDRLRASPDVGSTTCSTAEGSTTEEIPGTLHDGDGMDLDDDN